MCNERSEGRKQFLKSEMTVLPYAQLVYSISKYEVGSLELGFLSRGPEVGELGGPEAKRKALNCELLPTLVSLLTWRQVDPRVPRRWNKNQDLVMAMGGVLVVA